MAKMVRAPKSKSKAIGRDAFMAKVESLNGVRGKVGWFEENRYPDTGTPVAYVASIQELGAPQRSIPPRPFFRPTIKRESQAWADIAKQGAKAALIGNASMVSVMDALCLLAQMDVKKTISQITSPPLSLITLIARDFRRKGGKVTGKMIGIFAKQAKSGDYDISGVTNKPLIDTHTMIDTITSVVERK